MEHGMGSHSSDRHFQMGQYETQPNEWTISLASCVLPYSQLQSQTKTTQAFMDVRQALETSHSRRRLMNTRTMFA